MAKRRRSFVWLEVGNERQIVSSTPIALMDDGKVEWNGYLRNASRWSYVYVQESDIGFMTVQFAAGPNKPPKRHYMRQVAHGKFRLADKDEAIYEDSTALWDVGSQTHKNSNAVVMMQCDLDVNKLPDTHRCHPQRN